jgi:hypothetical protein
MNMIKIFKINKILLILLSLIQKPLHAINS